MTGTDTVFDDIFRLLTPERLLRDPRATGEGVSVALIDSGVERSVLAKPSSATRSTRSRGRCSGTTRRSPQPYTGHQSSPHGTTVADIVLTLAPRAKIYSADVFGPTGTSEVDTVIRALQHAIDVWKCKVVNLSLGRAGGQAPAAAEAAPVPAGDRGGVLQGRARSSRPPTTSTR